MNWNNYSFIIRGRIRKKVFVSLETAKTPTQISKIISISVSHVSRALKQFNDLQLAECITPKLKTGRVYELTKEGKELLNEVKKK